LQNSLASGRTQAGFTLLEMMIVLIIVGLALGLLVTRGTPRSPALEARLAASEVAQGLRLARGRAIGLNRPVGFILDVRGHSWRIDRDPPRALPRELYLGLVTVAGEVSGPNAGRIVFAPDGSSSGGRIELAGAGKRLAVGIDWLTGRVAIAEIR
jgi:general secretion pathway protein H